jgi:hypothetical protein
MATKRAKTEKSEVPTGNPLVTFDSLLRRAPPFVAWRWLMGAHWSARAAMIARLGDADRYNQIVNNTGYQEPPVTFYSGKAYWCDPRVWNGPYPQSIFDSGMQSVSVVE